LVPGVPNTTSHAQEIDQNYSPFKSCFRANIRVLSQARYERELSLTVTDLPLLVLGGTCPKTGVVMKDSFSVAFSIQANLSIWEKCGAVPLTRLPITWRSVWAEVGVGVAATLAPEEETDTRLMQLKCLESMNEFYCEILFLHGYDAKPLRMDAPTRKTYVPVTEPQSLQRVKAIKEAKTAGQLFFATGGRHINSDEFFKARELKRREPEIKKMEEQKAARMKYCAKQHAAIMMIRKKGELTWYREKLFTRAEILTSTLCNWKKIKMKSSAKKRELVDAYVDTPKPKIQKTWCRSEEQALQQLKDEVVELKSTKIGVTTSQMARAVTTSNNLANLDSESISALKAAIDNLGNGDMNNVI
jgi:hypothetical protein